MWSTCTGYNSYTFKWWMYCNEKRRLCAYIKNKEIQSKKTILFKYQMQTEQEERRSRPVGAQDKSMC